MERRTECGCPVPTCRNGTRACQGVEPLRVNNGECHHRQRHVNQRHISHTGSRRRPLTALPACALPTAATVATPTLTMASIPTSALGEDDDSDAVAASEESVSLADAAALNQKIAGLKAAVARGKAREAAQDARIGELETQNKRIAGLEADNASLTAEVTELRGRRHRPQRSSA